MQTTNERLGIVRLALGFKRKAEFAERVGIERSTYDKMEKGPHKPSAGNLNKIVSKYSDVSLTWLLSGKGSMFHSEAPEAEESTPIINEENTMAAEPVATYGCLSPDLVNALHLEVTELRTENKELRDELRQARRGFREDFIAQARQYNSVKAGQESHIASQQELIKRLHTKLDEYELRLGYRQPTQQEREQLQGSSPETRMEVKPFGARYRETSEEPQAALADEPGCIVVAMYPEQYSLVEAA